MASGHFRPWSHGRDIDHLSGPRFFEARMYTGGQDGGTAANATAR